MKDKTQKQKVGDIGEELASKFLVKHGYNVIERNYWKVFGEIDIICKKDGLLHFVEVKTVSRRTFQVRDDEYRPEDNVHPHKLKRIGRTIQTYLIEQHVKVDWKFHVVTVLVNSEGKTAKISIMKDIIIEEQ